jgi:hypothetical protein
MRREGSEIVWFESEKQLTLWGRLLKIRALFLTVLILSVPLVL